VCVSRFACMIPPKETPRTCGTWLRPADAGLVSVTMTCCSLAQRLRHTRIVAAAEISLFISGLQNSPVLHHYAKPASEPQHLQQAHYSGGKHFSFLDLASKL